MSGLRNPIPLYMIEPIPFSHLTDKPTTLEGYGITGPFPFIRTDVNQGLTEGQKSQAWANLGVPDDLKIHDPVTLGTQNGLSLSGQVMSLALATTTTPGAMSASDKLKLTGGDLEAGTGISLSGANLLRLLGAGDLTVSVDATVLRTATNQVITGLKSTRRAGPNNGSSANIVHRYEIGSDEIYKLDILNTQNVQSPNGEVQWFYAYTSPVNPAGDVAKTRDMVGFARGAVTILGGRALPNSYYGTILDQENSNSANPTWRYPLSVYSYNVSQNEKLIAGEGNHVDKMTGDTKVYVNGSIRTIAPEGDGVGVEANWRFGSHSETSDVPADSVCRVKVGDKVFDLLAREVV